MKYLFTAVYKDGRVYKQNAEDRSVTEPEKRSCYFDIAKDAEAGMLASFSIKGEGHEYKVDLQDGHFEVDCLPFSFSDGHLHAIHGSTQKTLLELKDYSLIYYRKKQQSIVVGVKDGEKKSQSERTIGFCIGWQAKANCGHAEQRIMEIP